MIKVVYEDAWLLIVDKPSGLLVIPTPKNERYTLTNILNQGLLPRFRGDRPDCVGPPRNDEGRNDGYHLRDGYHLYPCHRLDRDTSGLIIYAKGRSLQKKMMDEFKNRRVKKTYIAFVQGRLRRPHGQIAVPIGGRSALTRYRVLDEKEGFSVVEATPVTGRKNQLRLHFKHNGNPILGDTRFVFRRHFKVKAKRLCLHAKGLEFTHPITKKKISAEAELPKKLCELAG